MSLQDQIEASVTDSLVQLGRGSGISPEARERMAKIISAPVVFIAEDHAEAIREETKERWETAVREARSLTEGTARQYEERLGGAKKASRTKLVRHAHYDGAWSVLGRLRALLGPDSTEVK